MKIIEKFNNLLNLGLKYPIFEIDIEFNREI